MGKDLKWKKMGNVSILKAFFFKKSSLSSQIFLAKHLNPVFYVLIQEAPVFNLNFKKGKIPTDHFYHFYFRHGSGNGGR
jgi:hypothetical protein